MRRGIQFTGLVPSLAMRDGDLFADPFAIRVGLVIANPNMVGTSRTPAFSPIFISNAIPNRIHCQQTPMAGAAPRDAAIRFRPPDQSDWPGHDETVPPPNATGNSSFNFYQRAGSQLMKKNQI